MSSKHIPPRAVVFDLDGTLVDSLPLVLRSIAHAIEPFGPVRPTAEIFARLGGPPESFMPGLVGEPRHVPAALERMEAFHRANHGLIRPFDGAIALLGELRARGTTLAIWTGRDRASGVEVLAAHGLTDYFATVVYGDDLPTHKPEPEGLREILRRLDVDARHTIFVGDADVDVQGGAACAVDTLLIRHTRIIRDEIRALAHHAVDSPIEAYEWLLARGRPPAAR
ncbi:MAG: hypothetical protein RLZZ15_3030 [Verrucomicrobiota bacterium]|jgi:HAD superfamily hydrolase (TIGR01509 family)